MGKFIFFILALPLIFCSCKKNWVCSCYVDHTTESSGGYSSTYSFTTVKIIKNERRSTARPNCLSSVDTYSLLTYEDSKQVTIKHVQKETCNLEY